MPDYRFTMSVCVCVLASYGCSAESSDRQGESLNADDLEQSATEPRTAEGFENLAPELGQPLGPSGDPVVPAPPPGWDWYAIDGAMCRDGSPTGFYVHRGSTPKLLIFLEGGGACANGGFCAFNPANVNQALAGDGQTVLGSAFGAIAGRQQPGVYTQANHQGPPAGIFEFANPLNPFGTWSQIYVPYCTGDVHYGSEPNGQVPGLSNQKFVGYLNMRRFVSRIVPTFAPEVDQVILTGSSAGSFGALLNVSMVQDAFGNIPVDAIGDAGVPFPDAQMPVCLQQRWREAWGLNESFPPDCEGCRQADGGGMLRYADFLMRKHPAMKIGLISRTQDEVMRLFFSLGLDECVRYATADPISITIFQLFFPNVYYAAQPYTQGLSAIREQYTDTGRLATYFIDGPNPTFHQHLFRPDFYLPLSGGSTIAQWAGEFAQGELRQVGP